MVICHYVTPHNIVLLKKPETKGELLKTLTSKLVELNQLKNADHLSESIIEREHESSTFLPTGIAIPHSRVPDVSEITLVLGVIPEGFCETPQSDPTYLVFLFFSPIKEKEFGRHLKLLARISAVFRDPNFALEVAKADSADKIFAMLQQKERESAED